MPVAKIHVLEGRHDEARLNKVSKAVQDALMGTLGVPPDDFLKSYARYYNETRTHRSLDKDAPISRPVQRTGGIISHALLGGLHHDYVRV